MSFYGKKLEQRHLQSEEHQRRIFLGILVRSASQEGYSLLFGAGCLIFVPLRGKISKIQYCLGYRRRKILTFPCRASSAVLYKSVRCYLFLVVCMYAFRRYLIGLKLTLAKLDWYFLEPYIEIFRRWSIHASKS